MSGNSITTLRILHLPPLLSDERRNELFKHYGAVRTKTIRKSEKFTETFAEFPSIQNAEEVLSILHQLPVKGRRLSIEFANRNVSATCLENQIKDEDSAKADAELEQSKINFQNFMKKLNTWAPFHLMTQPIPPSLKYKYPKPNKNVILKIAMQLSTVPAFYTQVLHLMNKMNLPPPFDEINKKYTDIDDGYNNFEEFKNFLGIKSDTVEVPEENIKLLPQELQSQNQQDIEDDESELESEDEKIGTQEFIVPVKRKRVQLTNRPKIPKFVNPFKQVVTSSTSQKQRPQDMFDLPCVQKRKIQVKPLEASFKLLSDDKAQFTIEKNQEVEGFGIIKPTSVEGDIETEKNSEKLEFISSEQLHSNKISANDQRLLPVFKSYHPGKPSNRLYIKNLAKQVEESDLHFIYRRYILPSSITSDSDYNIRLMQEGRMKGQAFVTLPNTAQAQLAVEETNGYCLKEKPMVVQFAKVPKS